MAVSSFRRNLVAAGLVIAYSFLLGLPSLLPAEPDKDSVSGVDKIRKALNQTVNMEFADVSLRDALANLREQMRINLVVNVPEEAIMDQPAAINVQSVKLRSGLQALLQRYDLGYFILGEVLVITQRDVAVDRQLQQLVNVDVQRTPLADALKKLARETAANLVIDPREDSQFRLTMQLEEVPLEMAVRIMAEAANLKPVRVGNILFVTSAARANDLEADPNTKSPAQLRKLLEEGEYMLIPDEQAGPKLIPRTITGVGAARDR